MARSVLLAILPLIFLIDDVSHIVQLIHKFRFRVKTKVIFQIRCISNSKTDLIRLDCAHELKLPESDLDSGFEIPLEKCFQKCLFTKMGILKDGKLDQDTYKKVFGEMPAYAGAAGGAKLDKCFQIKETDICKLTFEIVKCLVS